MPDQTQSPDADPIDRALIDRVVATFYATVRTDPLLAPIFALHVADWDTHHRRIGDFWASVILGTGMFRGSPMQVHRDLPGLRPEHFARWLALFDAAVARHCSGAAAAAFHVRAERIARAFQAARTLPGTEPGLSPIPALI